jgi:NAD(P)-dependent dehydrogenase (short-subunit alcohol dehydrogenase family)
MVRADNPKVAFVTGGASGIGRATAEEFLVRGYATVIVDAFEETGVKAEAELRGLGDCTFLHCDVTDDSAVRDTVARTVGIYGRLDAAFNAAGIDGEHGKKTAEGSLENWNQVLAVDLTGVWSCMRYQIPEMLRNGGGAIVNCSSVAGIRGAATFSAYSAAKHGVIGLTRAAALEYAGQGVRVNAVCPAGIKTPLFDRLGPQVVEHLVATIPSGRLADPTEVASVVLWLCEDDSGFVTGQAIAIDGGGTAR